MCNRKSNGGMGFRNVREFNISLLGNQGWMLINHPEKLVSKIYRARYYPRGSFLNAKIGNNPSYIWRSVLESQSIIRKGIGCKVGNGQSINILEDPWLPMINEAYVQTHSEILKGQLVSSLMNTNSNSWDTDLILDVFNDRDANIILSIPVNKSIKDSWYWRREKMGQYSVKSAYLLMQEDKTNNSMTANSGFWRRLWNLKIPPKVKNFLWRAVSNCLPTKDMLLTRRVQVCELCPICNDNVETALHKLVLCPQAVKVWEQSHLPQLHGNFVSFSEWFQLVLQQRKGEEALISSMICWMLWKSKN